MRGLSSPTQSQSHGNTPIVSSTASSFASMGTAPRSTHLQGFAEILAAILQLTSVCLGKWIPYLGHRDCQARAHLERLSYFLHNPQISAERFYEPMLPHVLAAFASESVLLTLDTSMLWDQFCLIAVL